MVNYKHLYSGLFNAITDALELLAAGDVIALRNTLQDAQRHTEQCYPEDDAAPSKGLLTSGRT